MQRLKAWHHVTSIPLSGASSCDICVYFPFRETRASFRDVRVRTFAARSETNRVGEPNIENLHTRCNTSQRIDGSRAALLLAFSFFPRSLPRSAFSSRSRQLPIIPTLSPIWREHLALPTKPFFFFFFMKFWFFFKLHEQRFQLQYENTALWKLFAKS